MPYFFLLVLCILALLGSLMFKVGIHVLKDKFPKSIEIPGGLLFLTDKENQNLYVYSKAHKSCKFKRNEQRFTLKAVETGIGLSVKVKCEKCKKINDITDYESW